MSDSDPKLPNSSSLSRATRARGVPLRNILVGRSLLALLDGFVASVASGNQIGPLTGGPAPQRRVDWPTGLQPVQSPVAAMLLRIDKGEWRRNRAERRKSSLANHASRSRLARHARRVSVAFDIWLIVALAAGDPWHVSSSQVRHARHAVTTVLASEDWYSLRTARSRRST